MSAGNVIAAVLLVLGVGIELLCSLGVLTMRGVYDRLHYTGPASFGAVLISGAIVVREGFSMIGVKSILIAAFLLLSSPVLVHVTARAARLREQDSLGASAEEVEEE